MKANVSNGSGNYTYKWSTGVTTNQIILNANQQVSTSLHCVTVTDAGTNCTKVICKQYQKLSGAVEGSCGDTAKVFVRSGQRPYSFLWSDGSKDSFIVNKVVAASTYKLTVTDAKGCTLTLTTIINPKAKINSLPSSCSKDLFTLDAIGIFNGGYIFPDDSLEILQVGKLENLSVFQTGFTFKISNQKDTECGNVYIELPRLKKFSVKEYNTTCGTCNDGYIDVTEASDCRNCVFGSVKILKADKKTDVTIDNSKKALAKGTYFAVAEDKNGCYVEFKKVTIK